MKKLFNDWIEGVRLIIEEEIISFYVFFTTILAEIAFLWAHGHEHAFAFTIMLLACIANVLICSYFEKIYDGTKREVLVGRIYKIVFGVLFLIGAFTDLLTSIFLFIIPFAAIVILSAISDNFYLPRYYGSYDAKWKNILKEIFIFFKLALFIIVMGIPFITFFCFMWQNEIAFWLKSAISIICFILLPFMAIAEDRLAARSVFELAYDFKYNKLKDESEEEI